MGVLLNSNDLLIFVDIFSIFYFTVTSFFFNLSSIFLTYVFVLKLVASWFFVV